MPLIASVGVLALERSTFDACDGTSNRTTSRVKQAKKTHAFALKYLLPALIRASYYTMRSFLSLLTQRIQTPSRTQELRFSVFFFIWSNLLFQVLRIVNFPMPLRLFADRRHRKRSPIRRAVGFERIRFAALNAGIAAARGRVVRAGAGPGGKERAAAPQLHRYADPLTALPHERAALRGASADVKRKRRHHAFDGESRVCGYSQHQHNHKERREQSPAHMIHPLPSFPTI
mgnify:CR=1 FL=1